MQNKVAQRCLGLAVIPLTQ